MSGRGGGRLGLPFDDRLDDSIPAGFVWHQEMGFRLQQCVAARTAGNGKKWSFLLTGVSRSVEAPAFQAGLDDNDGTAEAADDAVTSHQLGATDWGIGVQLREQRTTDGDPLG